MTQIINCHFIKKQVTILETTRMNWYYCTPFFIYRICTYFLTSETDT